MLMAFFMPLGIVFSVYYSDQDVGALLQGFAITLACGFALWALTGFRRAYRLEIRKRESFVIVTLGWVFLSAFGALPFVLHGAIPSYTDAFFETMSGFTTTGASVLNDVEALPHGLLFWRSLTHWLGGMGIIVFSLALLPLMGVGGHQLFEAETSGPTKEKIHPQVQGTAKRLWMIYVALTGVQTLLLLFGGMSLFDALCHAFGTLATGGFSTRQSSVASFSPYIQYVILVFMFLAGTNFSLHYHAFHGRLRSYFKDEEFRFYLAITGILIVLCSFTVYFGPSSSGDLEKSFRDASFQVVSIISSTGFVTDDYEKWSHYSRYLFFVMLFFGASVGSTTGGIKMLRLLLLVKNGVLELKRLVHPRAVVPVRLNGRVVPPQVMSNILAFFVLYILVFIAGAFVLSAVGLDIIGAMGAVAASLGCIGPGVGLVGPMYTYAEIPMLGKWVLAFLMLLGRLELFTILVLFAPAFWKA